jgi:hypothetical protein
MDGRQFIMGLFRGGPAPAVLRMEIPLPTYIAILAEDGSVFCEGLAVPRLGEIGRLCRAMLAEGFADGAMQVRTPRGEPVCFSGSIAAIAEPVAPTPTKSPQFVLGLEPP